MKVSLEEIRERFRSNQATCEDLVHLFGLLGNKTRLRILCMLMDGEFCVNDIVETVQPGKTSNISQQLRILTLAGIVEKRRDQQMILYRLKDRSVEKFLAFLEDTYLKPKETA